MNKFKVVISTPNRMILVNGKLTRSPLTAIVEEQNLAPIRAKIAQDGILDFSIEPYVEEVVEEIVKPPVKKKKTAPKKKAATSTLEKIYENTE